jgi:hypothetical protein
MHVNPIIKHLTGSRAAPAPAARALPSTLAEVLLNGATSNKKIVSSTKKLKEDLFFFVPLS